MTAVRALGVTKQFEGTRALDGVDLVLEPGEVRGLLGPNGAGKTTLLRILFGLLSPDDGTVELFGRRPEAGRSWLDGVAGFIEAPSFYPYLTGRANLQLLGRLDGGVPPERIETALERVELHDRAEDRVNGYSTGMRQRLGIAAALIRAPRLLLLDEPTSGLTEHERISLAGLLQQVARRSTIVMAEHDVNFVRRIATRVTAFSLGAKIAEGTAAEVLANVQVREVFLRGADRA